MNKLEQQRTMMHSDALPSFCRWLAEVWSTRGVDVICEMLEKPYKFWPEWEEYTWLVEKTGDYGVSVTKEEFLENSEIHS